MITFYQSAHKTIISRADMQRVIETTLRAAKQSVHSDVSVHCIGDMKMTRLNAQYRGKAYPTDVLSFPLGENNDIGDLFLCVPQIIRQAKQFGVAAKEECIRMLAHGTLHLVGYDHAHPAEAKEMFALQERVVKKCI